MVVEVLLNLEPKNYVKLVLSDSLLDLNPQQLQDATDGILMETQDSLAASMRYNTDLFDASTIARMSQHFVTALRRIVREPTARLDSVWRTLAETDREQWGSVRKVQKDANSEKLRIVKRRIIAAPALSREPIS